MSYLGFTPPTVPWVVTEAALSFWDEQKVKGLVPDFPAVFDRAVADYAKAKVGISNGLFNPSEIDQLTAWFDEFPKLWETIRPNFIKGESGRAFGDRVDTFTTRLFQHPLKAGGLGAITAVVAGVLIVGGVAASLWAVGYIKSQNNISAMIDGVVAGKIPPAVLETAIEEESEAGLFGGLSGIVRWAVIGGLALTVLPYIWKK